MPFLKSKGGIGIVNRGSTLLGVLAVLGFFTLISFTVFWTIEPAPNLDRPTVEVIRIMKSNPFPRQFIKVPEVRLLQNYQSLIIRITYIDSTGLTVRTSPMLGFDRASIDDPTTFGASAGYQIGIPPELPEGNYNVILDISYKLNPLRSIAKKSIAAVVIVE